MSVQTYLTRVSLLRDVPASALRAVLLPMGEDQRVASAHRLIWTLFADQPDRARDFLWRESRPGEFYVLSTRKPVDKHGLFNIDAPREFAPRLNAGDRIDFALRANATVARSGGPGMRGKPCDIVMDALHGLPAEDRADSRKRVLTEVAQKWVAARGAKCGFVIDDRPQEDDTNEFRAGPVQVLGYHAMRIDRGRGRAQLSFGVLDLQGTLEITDSETFLQSVGQGFGRAKAFGCGLMLIKRHC